MGILLVSNLILIINHGPFYLINKWNLKRFKLLFYFEVCWWTEPKTQMQSLMIVWIVELLNVWIIVWNNKTGNRNRKRKGYRKKIWERTTQQGPAQTAQLPSPNRFLFHSEPHPPSNRQVDPFPSSFLSLPADPTPLFFFSTRSDPFLAVYCRVNSLEFALMNGLNPPFTMLC